MKSRSATLPVVLTGTWNFDRLMARQRRRREQMFIVLKNVQDFLRAALKEIGKIEDANFK